MAPVYVSTQRLRPRGDGSNAPTIPSQRKLRTNGQAGLLSPRKGEWVVYMDNTRPFIATVHEAGKRGLIIHEFAHKAGQWIPCWLRTNASSKEKILAKAQPKNSITSTWTIEARAVVAHAPRAKRAPNKWRIPPELEQAYGLAGRFRPEDIYDFARHSRS